MSDAIGALRTRVTLQHPTRVADEIGGAAILWVSAGDVWAEISANGASQGADYDAAPSVTSFSVVLYRCEDVRAGWRVRWGARVLRVTGVRDDGAPRMTLVCEEEIL